MENQIKFKTRCVLCGKYSTIQRGWRYCEACTTRNKKNKQKE